MTIQTTLLIIGGSDAGISAALRAKELAPDTDVTLLLADSYPNLSICGFPYLLVVKSLVGKTCATAPWLI